MDQHWETWAALKIGGASGSNTAAFSQGYLIRVYIDTPEQPTEPSGSTSPPEQIFYDTLIAVIMAILLTIVLYLYRNRKRKQGE